MHSRPALTSATVTVLALALSACGGTAGDPVDGGGAAAPGFGHVPGLGLNPGDGLVYAATHHGVFRIGTEGPQRVSDRYQDAMGFTITGPDTFLGSGHPDPRDSGPPHLGLVVSTDRGKTWDTVSTRGEADFHALSATGDTFYGWDSTTGVVMRSDDAGATWNLGAALDVADLDVVPAYPARVLVTSEDGLLESTDAGATFVPAANQPPRTLVLIDHVEPRSGQHPVGSAVGDPTVDGVAPDGSVWVRGPPGWYSVGDLGAPPEAFTLQRRIPSSPQPAAACISLGTAGEVGRCSPRRPADPTRARLDKSDGPAAASWVRSILPLGASSRA